MAIVPLTSNIIDGNLTFPVEVEGSPMITTDDVTRSKIITRSYAVLNSYYVPLNQGVADAVYNTSYLVNETPGSIQGPVLFFQRNFAQLPSPRTEARTISFTVPGASAISQSLRTGGAIGWNPYGLAAPYTRTGLATVTVSYAGVTPGFDPALFFVKPPITRITYNGFPVDFAGAVYKDVGTRSFFNVDGTLGSEPNWVLAGSTVPLLAPVLWVAEVNITRWRGVIWQMEVVHVNTATF